MYCNRLLKLVVYWGLTFFLIYGSQDRNTDYQEYLNHYINDTNAWEAGYNFFVVISKHLNLSFPGFYTLYISVESLLFALVFSKYPIRCCFFLILSLLCVGNILGTQIRFSMSIALVTYASQLYKLNGKSIIVFLLGISFHNFGIMFFFLYLISVLLRGFRVDKHAITSVILALTSIPLVGPAVEYFVNLHGYQGYLNTEYFEPLSVIGVLYAVFLYLLLLLGNYHKSSSLNFVCVNTLILLAAIVLSNYAIASGRLLVSSMILIALYMSSKYSDRKIKICMPDLAIVVLMSLVTIYYN